MTSRKIVIAVWTPLTSVPRSLLIDAIITFMFEPAKLQMNCASASGARTAPTPWVGRVAASLRATVNLLPSWMGRIHGGAAASRPIGGTTLPGGDGVPHHPDRVTRRRFR